MRKIHLLYLIAIIAAGLTSARLVSTGGAQPPLGRAAVNETRKSQTSGTGQADFALRGTALLTRPITEDIREEQRQQIIRYFTAQIAATPAKRDALWHPDFSSPGAYQASVEEHRAHLREMLGLVDIQLGTPQTKILYETANLRVEDVTLPTDSGINCARFDLFPEVRNAGGCPHRHPSRERKPGRVCRRSWKGQAPAPWLKALLARNVAVAIPITVERRDDHPICRLAGGKDRRRVLWRAGFIVGRTMVGLEVQQALALRQYLATRPELAANPIAVMGEGQGGMTALYAGAMDEHFAAVASLDYFSKGRIVGRNPLTRCSMDSSMNLETRKWQR